ncbi:MAG: dimethyl sulfoxide reductase anchor subunit family protein [Hyphomicrobiaceae bacterium]
MHPAYSVIIFTVTSGAGFGLLIWLAALALAGKVTTAPALGLVGLGLAFALVAAGLISSTAHLGRPERAWRAFSQWRTSWLSREGVLAVATFLPASIFALSWAFFGVRGPLFNAAGGLAIALGLASVYATGMIYQSLTTIRAWAHPLVASIYIVLAVATGGTLAVFVLRMFGEAQEGVAQASIAINLLAAILKYAYWRGIDTEPRTRTAGDATGLGQFGTVRVLDPPHTQANFVMREMGYAVARKHAKILRIIAVSLGFVVPAVLTAVSLMVPVVGTLLLAGLAVASMIVGIMTERWLFFAEAQHVVTLFYGAARA